MAMVTVKYLSLDLLLGSPFSLPGKVRAPSSLIYIKTWLIGVVSGVKFVNFRMGGLAGLPLAVPLSLPSLALYPSIHLLAFLSS